MQIRYEYNCTRPPILAANDSRVPMKFAISKNMISDSVHFSFELQHSCGAQKAPSVSVTKVNKIVETNFEYKVIHNIFLHNF